MQPEIKRLIERKQQMLERYDHPKTKQAIQFEIGELQRISQTLDDMQKEIETLKKENGELEDAKAIAEMVCLIHGIPSFIIKEYYKRGVTATLEQLTELFQENKIIVPTGLKPYFKK